MNELLLKRITRALENLDDMQGYRVLDYIEFLESKYGTGTRPPSLLERVSAGVEDTLRVTRVPVAAIRGTMGAVDSATRLFDRLATAGRAAVDELGRTVAELQEGPTGHGSTTEEGGHAPPEHRDEEPPASA